MTEILDGLMSVKKAMVTAAMIMAIHVHTTIVFWLPYFPAYFAPRIAKIMDGSIPMALRIVLRPILPITIPNIRVTTIDWEATCCAILSDAAEII